MAPSLVMKNAVPTAVRRNKVAGKASASAPTFSVSTSTTTSSSSSPDQLSSIQGDPYPPLAASSWPTLIVRKMFRSHGEFCASQPWEVIVATLMFLVCFLTVANKRSLDNAIPAMPGDSTGNADTCQKAPHASNYTNEGGYSKLYSTYTLFIIAMSCLSVIRCALHFHKIHAIGSNLVWKIAFAYLIFTWTVFALVVWSIEAVSTTSNGGLADSWFLIPLFTDMSKVTRMAQFALSSSHSRRISEKVANGMHVLAPSFFLDTVAWTLFCTLGFFTGIHQVSMFAKYTVVALLVNFFIYVTFYPAGLSLVLELMFSEGRPRWDVQQIIYTLPKEEGQSPNSHRVRVVVIAITSMLHIYFYFYHAIVADESSVWLCVFFMTCVICGAVYSFFNSDIDEAREMRSAYIAELTREGAEEESTYDHVNRHTTHESHSATAKTSRGNAAGATLKENEDLDPSSNSTDEGISLRSSVKTRGSGPTPSSRGPVNNVDDSSSDSTWSEVGYLPDFKDQEVQTTASLPISADSSTQSSNAADQDEMNNLREPRSLEECLRIKSSDPENGVISLNDKEILQLVSARYIRAHALESVLRNANRAVDIRRKLLEKESGASLTELPYQGYDYSRVQNACCESVIGFMPIPVGKAGPLLLDGNEYHVPMATTEGCLVASVNRGCRALREKGVKSEVIGDGMTRGPIVRFDDIASMKQCYDWLNHPEHFEDIKQHFDGTSRFARLEELKCKPAGEELFIRFKAKTGDAMGMNMLSKATEQALRRLNEVFPKMQIISLSGNFCTDKKPAAINWIDGRGKSVVCEATVSARVVAEVLKTTPERLADLNLSKNLVGSAQAGSIGGFNAQASNVVTAIFIATGQDAAQNVASSNCLTRMRVTPEGDLYMTVTMPSIEVGTIGGGTILAPQASCLELLGVRGSHSTSPGENATQLARVVAATVLAGELSLMSALAEGHLVRSHLRHNRSVLSMTAMASMPSMASMASMASMNAEGRM